MKAKNQHQSLHQASHLKVQINKIMITHILVPVSYTLNRSMKPHISLLMKRIMMNLLQRFNPLNNRLKKFMLNRAFIQLMSKEYLFMIERLRPETKFWMQSSLLLMRKMSMIELSTNVLHRRKKIWPSKFLKCSIKVLKLSHSIINEN